MNEFDVRCYVAAFNASDFDYLSRYYSNDVICELWSREPLVGLDNLMKFYRTVKSHVVEIVDLLDVIVTPSRVAMHCRVSYETVKNWPDPENWESRVGDRRVIETLALHDIEERRFSHMRAAKFKP